MLPHYQNVKYNILDGKRLFEDITYGDSFGNEFYALVDGSYILVEEGKSVLHGTAYRIKDGELKPFTLKMGELTADEREIILKGCLINYNRK